MKKFVFLVGIIYFIFPSYSLAVIPLTDRLNDINFIALKTISNNGNTHIQMGIISTQTTSPINPINVDEKHLKYSKGIGSIITYDKRISDKVAFSISLRGIHEFDIKYRPDHESYQLSFNLKYQ